MKKKNTIIYVYIKKYILLRLNAHPKMINKLHYLGTKKIYTFDVNKTKAICILCSILSVLKTVLSFFVLIVKIIIINIRKKRKP